MPATNNIGISPNTATTHYLRVSSNTQALLVRCNISGKLVLQQELQVGEQQIKIGNLLAGAYICQVKGNHNIISWQKVVILRQ